MSSTELCVISVHSTVYYQCLFGISLTLCGRIDYNITMSHLFVFLQGKVSPLLFWEENQASAPSHPEPVRQPEHQPATPSPSPPPSPTPSPTPAATEDYKPKLCRLEKTPAGFGFHLNGIQGVTGQYIKEVQRRARVCTHEFYCLLHGGMSIPVLKHKSKTVSFLFYVHCPYVCHSKTHLLDSAREMMSLCQE